MATRARFSKLIGGSADLSHLPPEEQKRAREAAERRKKRRAALLHALDFRSFDLFGYEPDYTFPGYRSRFGASASVILACAVLLRASTRAFDFLYPEPIISENRLMFQRDLQAVFELPSFGLVFKKDGWKPFYDPTFFRFRFQQGYSGRASNSTYVDLGDQPCSFVDSHGRIIEDEARCPNLPGVVVGNFFDDKFRFVHVAMARCHNGTDATGRAKPGPCRRPDEIDKLVAQGTVTVAIALRDLDTSAENEYASLYTLKKQFWRGVHATYDLYFTVRFVTVQPRAFFDSLDRVWPEMP